MESYLQKSVTRIKDASKRLKDLKAVCDETLEYFNSADYSEENVSDDHLKSILKPFILGCESKNIKIIEISLDAIHYMIEHAYFKGKSTTTIRDNSDSDEGKTRSTGLTELVIDVISKCADEFDENVQLQVVKSLLTAITSLQCEVHGASLLVSVRACFHIHLISKNPVIKTTAKAALTQIVNVVNQRMEVNDTILQIQIQSGKENDSSCATTCLPIISTLNVEMNGVADDTTGNTDESVNTYESFKSIYQKDSYLLFRALCKLSMKGLTEENSAISNDNILLQNKILSLELLLNLLQNCGQVFRAGEKFISAIRSYLCVSLLNNCTSNVAQVTGLSLQIFILLVQNFKEHLKGEMEVFVSTIFFRILDSENSTYDHKYRVLEVLHHICRDSKDLVELFINYDCDLDAANLFSRIISAFAKVAKNPNFAPSQRITVEFITSNGKKQQYEELNIKGMALEGIVLILKSLSNILTDSNNNTSKSPDFNSRKELNSAELNSNAIIDDESAENDLFADGGTGMVKIVEAFDKKLKIQQEIETGILKFNLSPMKGIKFLASLGHLEMAPKAVAEFLHLYQEKLDKTMIGELLGREKEYENGFSYKVLNEYVDNMDFSEMKFDIAIRYFLHGFRLPGEAQKIDRIMEKFAEKYFLQHKTEFASADMAFILAFSTIMLQTNLHNPAIRDDKRMTKEQFIKQNKGISSDGELPDDLLGEIYDRISAEPISINQDQRKIKKDDNGAFVVFQSLSDRRKKDAFNNERKEMVRAGEAMIRQGKKRTSVFVKNVQLNEEAYVRPMFDVAWPPIFGVISQILEQSDDIRLIDQCLSAFQYCISLSCRIDNHVARNTLLNALSKFTTLDTIREMRSKNVSCIKLLLNVALMEGEFLEESWLQILQIISQLARLQLFANGGHSDDLFFGEASSSSKKHRQNIERSPNSQNLSDPLTKLFLGPSKAESNRLVEEANAEMIWKDIDPVLVDKIFLSSINLSGTSVIHFVHSLCEVSMIEILHSGNSNALKSKEGASEVAFPRIFSLQKLVEVADYNMNSRSRVDWSNIWKLLAQHFSNVGLSENNALSMYAIDSLKQLSIKFLQKNELSNFNFQRLFLKPFETIMSKAQSVEIKDLILRCIEIMIKACADNIRSGWKSIFGILENAAIQDVMDVSKLAFGIIENLMVDRFELIVCDFVELMHCLVSFVSCPHMPLSLRALNYLSKCADHLADGSVIPFADSAATTEDGTNIIFSEMKHQIDEDASVFRLWWPLLLGLSARVADARLQVRLQALNTLRDILTRYGKLFSAQTWSVIFKGILFPMIDSAKIDSTDVSSDLTVAQLSQSKQSWIGTMALNVLNTCVELYNQNLANDRRIPLLPDLLTMLESCITQGLESLAIMAMGVYSELVLSLPNLDENKSARLQFCDLVFEHSTKCMMNNLYFDFADAGKVALNIYPCPPFVNSYWMLRSLHKTSILSRIPLNSTYESTFHRTVESYSTEGVSTNVGNGKLIQVIHDSTQTLPDRAVIKLEWGAILYTCDILPADNLNREYQNWDSLILWISTSMLITLDMIKLVESIFQSYGSLLSVKHIEGYLNALETCHWHAYGFNENLPLRLKLQQHGLLSRATGGGERPRVPHLLDQEVFSIEVMLIMCFKVYFGDLQFGTNSKAFIIPWIQRLTTFVLMRYAGMEQKQLSKNTDSFAVNSDEEDEDAIKSVVLDDFFLRDRHNAYHRSVIIILNNLNTFTIQEFHHHRFWIMPLLCKLILCESYELRVVLSAIFDKFVGKNTECSLVL